MQSLVLAYAVMGSISIALGTVLMLLGRWQETTHAVARTNLALRGQTPIPSEVTQDLEKLLRPSFFGLQEISWDALFSIGCILLGVFIWLYAAAMGYNIALVEAGTYPRVDVAAEGVYTLLLTCFDIGATLFGFWIVLIVLYKAVYLGLMHNPVIWGFLQVLLSRMGGQHGRTG